MYVCIYMSINTFCKTYSFWTNQSFKRWQIVKAKVHPHKGVEWINFARLLNHSLLTVSLQESINFETSYVDYIFECSNKFHIFSFNESILTLDLNEVK